MKKSKPKPGRREPYLCENHPKRLAQVTRHMICKHKDMDVCWVCFFEDILLTTVDPHAREVVKAKLARWIKEYDRLEQ